MVIWEKAVLPCLPSLSCNTPPSWCSILWGPASPYWGHTCAPDPRSLCESQRAAPHPGSPCLSVIRHAHSILLYRSTATCPFDNTQKPINPSTLCHRHACRKFSGTENTSGMRSGCRGWGTRRWVEGDEGVGWWRVVSYRDSSLQEPQVEFSLRVHHSQLSQKDVQGLRVALTTKFCFIVLL